MASVSRFEPINSGMLNFGTMRRDAKAIRNVRCFFMSRQKVALSDLADSLTEPTDQRHKKPGSTAIHLMTRSFNYGTESNNDPTHDAQVGFNQ